MCWYLFLTPEICLDPFSTTTFVTWCFFGQMFACHVPSLHHVPNSWKYLYTIWYNYQIPGPSSEGTRSLVQYSLLPNFWLGRYPPVDCIFCLILFIIVVQIGVLHYINHFKNGLLCVRETTSMSCLDSCDHLGLWVWSLHKYYEKLVPINWRLCLVIFVITNLD